MSAPHDTNTVPLEEMPVGALLAGIAARTPTPGGGAVAAVTAALGVTLGHMVVAYSTGKKSLHAHAALHQDAARQLDELRHRAMALARADEEAYGALNQLWRLDAEDPVRVARMPDAVRAAIAAPADVLALAEELLGLAERLVGATNAMLASDLAICAILGEAAARSAAWNVRINTPLLDDPAEARRVEDETAAAVGRVTSLCAAIESGCRADRT